MEENLNEMPVKMDWQSSQNITEEKQEIIKIIGVGGAGSNAVNTMYEMGVKGVNYVVCNTDLNALEYSPVHYKIQLGKELTGGLGSGFDPEVGKNSAIEALPEIEKAIDGGKMAIITAGMGKGTGTGAAPVIAKCCKDNGLLTIGIVIIPKKWEGIPQLRQAIRGAQEMSKYVDSLLVINADRLADLFPKMPLEEQLRQADMVLAVAAKGLAELISIHRVVNTDFNDVKRVMENSGCSLIGTGEASGENRAEEVINMALNSPLLNNNDITGCQYILINVSTHPSSPIMGEEHETMLKMLFEKGGGDANESNRIIWGAGNDDNLPEGVMRATVIATGFTNDVFQLPENKGNTIKVGLTDDDKPKAKKDGGREVVFVNPETKAVQDIIDNVYKSPKHSGNDMKDYDTRQLRDATSLSLYTLTEEVLSNLENVPAYVRRQNP